MIKLLKKYLKPFVAILLVSIALLFLQAFSDLNLPNYMSNIVNIGIQQGGITSSAPSAISAQGYDLMTTFMTGEQQEYVAQHYTQVPQGSQQYAEEYPLSETEDIFVLDQADEHVRERLNRIFGEASWTMIYVMQDLMPASQQQDSSSIDLENMDFSEIYQMLPMLRSQVSEQTLLDAQEKASHVQDTMQDQTGAAFSKIFYNELGVNTQEMQDDYILRAGLMMLLIALVGVGATVSVGFLSSKVAAGVATRLRSDIFSKVQSFSAAEFNKFSTSSLITRTGNDIRQIQMLLYMGIRMICYAPIIGTGGIIMALEKSVSMSWVIAVAVIALLALIVGIFLVAMPKFKIMQKLIDKLNLVARENLSGLMVIRAFGTQKFEEDRFDQANTTLAKNDRFVNRVMVFMMPMMMFIMNCTSLLIVWVGAHQIEQSTMQVGDMMAYMQYAMLIIMAFLMIAMMFIMVPRAAVSADRILEVLETEPTLHDPAVEQPMDPSKTGWVEFKDVSFKYGDAEDCVIEHITFTSRPGQTTAFIGSTGAGKSTLVNLIPQFYDVTDGQVLVNGVDVRNLKQHTLHEQIGYVPQKGMLLSGTIASNLRYGKRDATEEELQVALDIAQASDFVAQKEDGIESLVSQGGVNVSGGQKQRLSIARALVKKAPVYIFDDSFSALDFKTDVALRRALKPYTKNSTVLIVAQRISTIMKAEQIIVLDEGKMVGKGTHEELMKNCPTYIEIANSQFGGDEL